MERSLIGRQASCFIYSNTLVPIYLIHILLTYHSERLCADYGVANVIGVVAMTAGCPFFWVPYRDGDTCLVGAVAAAVGYLASEKKYVDETRQL